MYNATEQLAEINKAGYDNAVKLAALSLEKAERLTKLNLQAAKVALEQGVYSANAVAGIKDVQEFVRLGAYIEHSMCMYHPQSTFHLWDFDRLLRWIQIVGPERTLLGSDLGQKNNPLPVEGLRFTVEKLLDKGVKEGEIEMMVKNNAAALLGLEGSANPRGSTSLKEAAV